MWQAKYLPRCVVHCIMYVNLAEAHPPEGITFRGSSLASAMLAAWACFSLSGSCFYEKT
jgi:hypothetical protein